MFKADLGIVGAGPAGCAAAIHAAGLGLKAVVIESQPDSSANPGETLHPGAEAIFRQLGVLDELENFHRHTGIISQWDGEQVFRPYGRDVAGEWRGWQIPREELHAVLRRAVERGGSEIRRAEPLRVHELNGRIERLVTDAGTLQCRFYLDATGRCRWLARQLGVDAQDRSPRLFASFGWARGTRSTGDPKIEATENGWRWRAPLGSAGIAYVRLVVATDGESACEHPSRREVTWKCADPVAKGNWFLLGDAARELDPASSHGVLRAMMSGIMAAHACAATIAGLASEEVARSAYIDWLQASYLADEKSLRELYNRHPSARVRAAFAQGPRRAAREPRLNASSVT